MKFILILFTCIVIILSGCSGTEIVNSEAAEAHILSISDETIEFDTLCFNGSVIVDTYKNIEFVSGCTTNADEIESVINLIENLPIKEPTTEEVIERHTAIAETDNYQIYLRNGLNQDNPDYTITLYEDGIIQYSNEMVMVENITTESYVDKYIEVKRLLDEMAE